MFANINYGLSKNLPSLCLHIIKIFNKDSYPAMKVTTIMQFFLGLMVCNCHVVVSGSFYGNETDRLALLDFKNAISFDPQQALLSWNDSTHFCNWEGILCRVKTPFRVTSLNLTNRALVGKISPSLGNLTFLKHLVLPKNAFVGEIPQSFGHLHRLQALYLTNNTLRGRIPSLANCSKLMVLWLNRNQLDGQFPADLPPRLEELQLSYNELTGIIPVSLANITMLNKLASASNHLEGNIPNEFAKFPVLQLLYMGGNKFRGSFPQAILNISTLMDFSLAFCDLSGELPPNLGSSLPNLEMLELPANFFRGHIPYSLTNASNLYFIELSGNNFTGMVPNTIGKLNKLSWLNLEFNKLQARNKQDWEFMNSLTNCTELQLFSMTGNHLEGHVPNSLGNLSNKLQNLHLAINHLSGGFPSGIAHLPNLFIVALGMNGFTGAVPEWLGSLKKIETISLHNNMFTGFIPSSFSNLSQLGVISLEFNQFSGNIPPNLGNLPMLRLLSISNNNLHGSIPKEIFAIPTILQISLSFNNLDAALHTDIGNAKQLTYLQLSSNKLSGDIPNTLGNCESLEHIEMDGNTLSGSIPTSLGNIHSLKVLNLSHNNLSGSIPASLGNLELLEQLDLSNNQLKGEVPKRGIFGNATAMQIDGNQGLCGGPIELHLPACYMTPLNSSKHKLSIVLKVVIPLVSMVTLAMAISLLLLWRAREKRKCVSLPSFGTKFPKVSYSDLAKATEGFSTTKLIGRGRYSSVYQGKLCQHRNPVAIKVFSLETKGAQKSFIAECNTLRNVRHRNLVPILTACSSIDSRGNDFKALVYELMPKGDLHVLLYAYENSSALNHITLAQRLRIVVDISDALMYLHHNNQDTIIHCDLKPSNILMDDNMIAHVGDFGLARLKNHWTTSSHGDSTSSSAINGTIGYVAPECATGAQVSIAADVYSFGVVLLEIFLRKRPTDDMFKDGLNIANFVEMNFPDRITQIVDPDLLKDQPDFPEGTPVAMKGKDLDCLLSVLNIGLCCTKLSPNERLNMQEVAARLHRIRDAYLSGN